MKLLTYETEIERQNVALLVKAVAKEIAQELKEDISEMLKRLNAEQKYPPTIKGDIEAAKFISKIEGANLTANALRGRINRGWYKQGLHFRQISDKFRAWDRDALLNYQRTKDE